jgi:hypothetical protein
LNVDAGGEFSFYIYLSSGRKSRRVDEKNISYWTKDMRKKRV